MSNRTAVIVSAVIAGFVAIFGTTSPVSAAPAADEAAPAADECLSAPKATTPAGAHWYYRIEKGTKRKCWYLSDEGGKVKKPATAATTTAPPPVAEQDAPPPSKKPMRNSIANARAEFTTGSPDDDKSLAESTWPPLSQGDRVAVRDDNQIAAIQPAPEPANTQGWNIASRWPEAKTVASAEEKPTAPSPEPAQPASALTPDRLAAAAAAATPAPAAAQVSAALPDNTARQANASSDDAALSMRVLLSVLVCALALAAIIGPMIFRYIRPRKDEQTPSQRRPVWDMNTPDGFIRQDNPRMTSSAYFDAPPEPRILDEAVDELENLLARASKRSAA